MKRYFILLLIFIMGCYSKENILNNREHFLEKQIEYISDSIENADIIFAGVLEDFYVQDETCIAYFTLDTMLYQERPLFKESNYPLIFGDYNDLIKDILPNVSTDYVRVFIKRTSEERTLESQENALYVEKYITGHKYFVFICKEKKEVDYGIIFMNLRGIRIPKELLESILKWENEKDKYVECSNYGYFVRNIQNYSQNREDMIKYLIEKYSRIKSGANEDKWE